MEDMVVRIQVAATVVAMVSLGLAACGSSTGVATVTGTPPGPSAAAGGTTLTAADFMFTPNALTALPGARVTITFQNTGSTTHNFTQGDLNINQDVTAGASTTITFTAPASGTLNFHCMYHPTRMTGTIVVGAAGAAAPSSSPASTSSGAGYGAGY